MWYYCRFCSEKFGNGKHVFYFDAYTPNRIQCHHCHQIPIKVVTDRLHIEILNKSKNPLNFLTVQHATIDGKQVDFYCVPPAPPQKYQHTPTPAVHNVYALKPQPRVLQQTQPSAVRNAYVLKPQPYIQHQAQPHRALPTPAQTPAPHARQTQPAMEEEAFLKIAEEASAKNFPRKMSFAIFTRVRQRFLGPRSIHCGKQCGYYHWVSASGIKRVRYCEDSPNDCNFEIFLGSPAFNFLSMPLTPSRNLNNVASKNGFKYFNHHGGVSRD